jgi:LPXTG-motif cell wall-anchored protein
MRRRVGIVIIVGIVLSLGIVNIVSAHAKLVSSDPAAGAKLSTAPSKVTLVFSEEISDKETDSFFKVTDEQGAEVGTGKLDNTDLDHKTLSGTLKSGLGDGVYTVTWQTITPDDNGKSEGSFKFGVNKDPGAQPTAEPEPTEAPEPTAAAGAANPTAASPTQPAGAASPSGLPATGEGSPSLASYILIAAVALLAAALVLRRSKHHG